jgi:hypothetical protein
MFDGHIYFLVQPAESGGRLKSNSTKTPVPFFVQLLEPVIISNAAGAQTGKKKDD